MEQGDRKAIPYPKLHEIVGNSGYSLMSVSAALKDFERMIFPIYFIDQIELQQKDRKTLAKLILTIDQLAMVEDLALFELARGCPRQLDQYDLCLLRLRKKAIGTEVCLHSFTVVGKVHETIRLLSAASRPLYRGLS